MEREEAIKICKQIRDCLCGGNPAWKFNVVFDTEQVHEALTTAIIDMKMMPRMLERLGKVNLVKCDLIDRTALMDKLKPQWSIQDDDEFANKTIWRELSDAPSVTLEDISNAYENGYAQGKFEANSGNSTNQ